MADIPPASPTNSPVMPHTLIFPIVNVRKNSTLKMVVLRVDSIFHAATLKQVPSFCKPPIKYVY